MPLPLERWAQTQQRKGTQCASQTDRIDHFAQGVSLFAKSVGTAIPNMNMTKEIKITQRGKNGNLKG
jgi:hypothetical protein